MGQHNGEETGLPCVDRNVIRRCCICAHTEVCGVFYVMYHQEVVEAFSPNRMLLCIDHNDVFKRYLHS